jgi:hypothetical protein
VVQTLAGRNGVKIMDSETKSVVIAEMEKLIDLFKTDKIKLCTWQSSRTLEEISHEMSQYCKEYRPQNEFKITMTFYREDEADHLK